MRRFATPHPVTFTDLSRRAANGLRSRKATPVHF